MEDSTDLAAAVATVQAQHEKEQDPDYHQL